MTYDNKQRLCSIALCVSLAAVGAVAVSTFPASRHEKVEYMRVPTVQSDTGRKLTLAEKACLAVFAWHTRDNVTLDPDLERACNRVLATKWQDRVMEKH